MESSPSIKILVGMIASGKSTYCRKASKEGDIIVNDDSIITSIHGGNYTLYDEKLKPLYKSIESNIIHSAILAGRNVIIDRTNLSRKVRARYIFIAKSLGVQSELIVMPMRSPEDHAIMRSNSDSRGHSFERWLEVANKHRAQYEVPSQTEEQFDSIRIINEDEMGILCDSDIKVYK